MRTTCSEGFRGWRTSYHRGKKLSADLSKAYELLGVKPGVSVRELKAAHRDLAKVWHPDRFQHDPRLQEKAQEKLKEINEAYELISSGVVPKPFASPQREQSRSYVEPKPTGHGINWQWAMVPLLVFVAVFAITTRQLLQRRAAPVIEEQSQVEETASLEEDRSSRSDSNTRADESRKTNADDSATQPASPNVTITEPTPALETVTVTVDPETGLLARPDCPLRSRMTYPIGAQPSGQCNFPHTPPPKESRIKSLTKTVRALE